MKSLGNIFAFALIIALVGALFYMIYQGTLVTWQFVEVLDIGTRVVLIASSITALLVALLLVYGQRTAAVVGLKGRLSKRRYELYVNMLASLRALFDPLCSSTQRDELDDFLQACNAEFLLLASGSTVKAYLALQIAMKSDDERLALACLETLWKKMRKDLGIEDNFEIFNPDELSGLLPNAASLKLHKQVDA